jgi:hypothetical protein
MSDWVSCINGNEDYGFEIAICRKSFPHGFVSWGWGDPQTKIILTVIKRERWNGSYMPDVLWEQCLKFKEMAVEFSRLSAEAMNRAESKAEELTEGSLCLK